VLILLWHCCALLLKEIGHSAMRAQVATFAGWPMPSQSGRLKRPQKTLRKDKRLNIYLIVNFLNT
jgi:hypothetical protein